ncbi:MAG TPA: tRNA (adenosine(37)-N6)-dimethylallyltransferase MiaA [Bacteroidota bacterium]|nr:tRNA (adenosine(37)-N6)-dimethylallyltransferase MiaA [Bacteroidota bacterium]
MRKLSNTHRTRPTAEGVVSDNSNTERRVLVLVGPTASGKTAVSFFIAQHLKIEIISADSRQIYRYMDIGTAKPSGEDRQHIPHHFIDILTPDTEFNAGEYGKEGRRIVDEIFQRKRMPLVVGGSGLYIQSLVDGFFEGPSADKTIRKKLNERLATEGADKLLEQLRSVDPVAASKMISSNTRRIIRALEVYALSGVPISQLQQNRRESNFTPIIVGLQWDRKMLYERINRRVEWMLKQGFVEEVRKLQSLGYSRDLNAMQTVGYKEVYDFLEGKTDYDRMVELMKQNSRRFAKRQLTWFRRDKRIKWYDVQNEEELKTIAVKICDYFGLTKIPL